MSVSIPNYSYILLSAAQKCQTRWTSPSWETYNASDMTPSRALREIAQSAIDLATQGETTRINSMITTLQEEAQKSVSEATAVVYAKYNKATQGIVEDRAECHSQLKRKGYSYSLAMEFYRTTYLGDPIDFQVDDAYILAIGRMIDESSQEEQEKADEKFANALTKIRAPVVDVKTSRFAKDFKALEATKTRKTRKVLKDDFGVDSIDLLGRYEYETGKEDEAVDLGPSWAELLA